MTPGGGHVNEMMPVWHERFRVRSYEMGATTELSIPGLCNWMQETAGDHAAHLGWSIEKLAAEGLTWVLSRLRVRLDQLPCWRDEAVLETWPSGLERLFSLREFRLLSAGGRVMAEAATAWLLVDADRRRPLRPPAAIADLAVRTPGHVFEESFGVLPELKRAESCQVFDVRFGEVDLNRHVNNVAIVSWVLESLGPDVVLYRRLREIEVEFRAESILGDCIEAVVEAAGDIVLHRLVRRGDGREIARARTRWCGR